MSSIGTGYDLSASQFSPDGRVFQVEYAQKAIENSGTAIGLRGRDGVVFAEEKLVTSKLYEPGANRRLFSIDRHIGMAIGGLLADARQIVARARSEATKYRQDNGGPIPVVPFGCGVIVGSYESSGPQMYMVDPSGVYHGYYGIAIGKAKQAAKTEMEKVKFQDMTCEELVNEAAKIIYIVHDEVKDKAFELELSWVGAHTNGLHQRVPDNIFQKAEEYAKSALKEDSDSEIDDS